MKDSTSKTVQGAKHQDLRVVIVKEGEGMYFAQGLEIDVATQGASIEDAQQRFENTLRATIHYSIEEFGSMHGLLGSTPNYIWKRYFLPEGNAKTYRQAAIRRLEHEAGSFEILYVEVT